MRFVTAAEVRKALTFPMLVAALETAHRRAKVNILDGMLGTEKELYFARSAVDPGRFMGEQAHHQLSGQPGGWKAAGGAGRVRSV